MWNKLPVKLKNQFYRLFFIFGIYLGMMFLPLAEIPKTVCWLLLYFVVSLPILKRALYDLRRKDFFSEHDLMTYATFGALVLGEWEEAVAVMLFYSAGEWLEKAALHRSRHSLQDLLMLRPSTVSVERDGELVSLDISEVKVGEVFAVRAGERIALDGKILSGESLVDTSSLTGESLPKEVKIGEEVSAGFINLNAYLRIEVLREDEDSAISRVIRLVEEASAQKSKTENFTARFAHYYTPIVVLLGAVLMAVPLFVGDWTLWVYRALNFLVVSCPCALLISVPLSFFGGLGAAGRRGILVKGGDVFERVNAVKVMAFDKTGTLSEGKFHICDIQTFSTLNKQELYALAAALEACSGHPLASAFPGGEHRFAQVKELSGRGMMAAEGGSVYRIGNYSFMQEARVEVGEKDCRRNILYLSKDRELLGLFILADRRRKDVKETLLRLKKGGIAKLIILSGDKKETVESFGKELAIDEMYAELYPEEKYRYIEKWKKEGTLAYVGDGINDAPSLMAADVGVAMGGASDASLESADAVLVNDSFARLETLRRISRKTVDIAKQNIAFAIGVKVLILLLSVLGKVDMWLAVFGDVGVTAICILNAARSFLHQE